MIYKRSMQLGASGTLPDESEHIALYGGMSGI